MKTRAFLVGLGAFVLATAVVSAWMLVPLSDRPLASLNAAQGNRVIWGWAIATFAFGLFCLWLVMLLNVWLKRAGAARF